MRLLRAIGAGMSMVVVGGGGIALLDVFNDLRSFFPCGLTWLPFLAPMIVGVAFGIVRPNFRMNLIIAAATSVFSTAAYFLLYLGAHLPAVSFAGTVYPPDPGEKFIVYFLVNAVSLVGGVTIGGFFSGE